MASRECSRAVWSGSMWRDGMDNSRSRSRIRATWTWRLRGAAASASRTSAGGSRSCSAVRQDSTHMRNPDGFASRSISRGPRMTDESARRLKVAIVDDEALARGVLREYLASVPDIDVVAECANGFEAVKAVADLHPDLMF